MGDYLTTAELETRFEDPAELEFLTNKAPGTGVDTAVLDDVIEAAEGELNSAFANRYETPVDVSLDTTLAALLKRKTLDLAEFYLYRRGSQVPEVHIQQSERVLEWLDKVAKGERRLVGALTPASTTSGDPRASFSDSGRTRRDDTAREWTRKTTGRL